MSSPKLCSYCQRPAKPTREHIWPASIVRYVNERARYAPNIAKMIWSDLVIKDVCQACNSGPLSELDAYGSQLFQQYFSSYVKDATPVTFQYDFSMLARWLLKLSFNSARAAGSDIARLARYAPALIDLAEPLPDDFSMTVDLVLPSAVPGVKRELLPASNRLCRVEFTNGVGDWCTVRLVAINSYYFWILIQNRPDSEVNVEHARVVLWKIKGAYLDRSARQVLITPSGATTLEMHKDWVSALGQRGRPAEFAKPRGG